MTSDPGYGVGTYLFTGIVPESELRKLASELRMSSIHPLMLHTFVECFYNSCRAVLGSGHPVRRRIGTVFSHVEV